MALSSSFHEPNYTRFGQLEETDEVSNERTFDHFQVDYIHVGHGYKSHKL